SSVRPYSPLRWRSVELDVLQNVPGTSTSSRHAVTRLTVQIRATPRTQTPARLRTHHEIRRSEQQLLPDSRAEIQHIPPLGKRIDLTPELNRLIPAEWLEEQIDRVADSGRDGREAAAAIS